MASLSIVESTGAASAASVIPEPDSALSDVAEAYAYLEACRDRAERAKSVFVEVIRDARMEGARLADIAERIGCTRQYVQKIIREANAGEELAEREAAYFAAKAKADEREQLRGLGFTAADRQCGVCHRFKSAPSAVCDFCGDDPVTHNGSARDYDAAHAGGIR